MGGDSSLCNNLNESSKPKPLGWSIPVILKREREGDKEREWLLYGMVTMNLCVIFGTHIMIMNIVGVVYIIRVVE